MAPEEFATHCESSRDATRRVAMGVSPLKIQREVVIQRVYDVTRRGTWRIHYGCRMSCRGTPEPRGSQNKVAVLENNIERESTAGGAK